MENKCISSARFKVFTVLVFLNTFQYQMISAIQVKEGVNEITTTKSPILQLSKDNKSINSTEEGNITLSSRQIGVHPLPNQNFKKYVNNITDKLTIPSQVISKNGHIISTRESTLIASYNQSDLSTTRNGNEYRNSNVTNFSPSPELKVPTEYSSQLVESSAHDEFVPIDQHNAPYNNGINQKPNGDYLSPFNLKTESGAYRLQPSSVVPDKSPWSLSFPVNEEKPLNNQYLPVNDNAQLKTSVISIDTNMSHQYQNSPALSIYQPYPYEVPPNPQSNPPIIFPSEQHTMTNLLANEQSTPFILSSTTPPDGNPNEEVFYDRPEYVKLGYLKNVEGDMLRVRKSVVLRNLLKIFATMVPIGLLLSALAPHYITLNPNITLPYPLPPYSPYGPPQRPLLPGNRPPPPLPTLSRPPPLNSIRYPPSGNRFYRVFSERDFNALKEFLKKIKDGQKKNSFLTTFASCEQRYICEMALLAVDLDAEKNSARTLYKILWEISNELSINNTPEKIDDIFKAVNKNDCEKYECKDYHLKTTIENDKN